MELNERIKYLYEQVEESAHYRDLAMNNENYELAVLNMNARFREMLELGLIQWRLGRKPVEYLENALRGLLQDRETLLGVGARPEVVRELSLFYSSYLASLLHTPHPPLQLEDYDTTMAPIVFVGNVLLGADSIENWPLHEDKLPQKRRTTLARATYGLYAGLLSGKMSHGDGVRKGEVYYARRQDDPYFEDSPLILGGTERNDRLVDFQLAAVLKHIGSTVPSIHAWRW